MSKYSELKNKISEHSPEQCFFAFTKEQFEQGKKQKNIPPDAEVVSGPMGIFGTKEGIENFFKYLDSATAEIAQQCEPQDVYDSEYCNHECSYVGDDEEAIKIVVEYFGLVRARQVKRKFAYYTI